MQAVASSAEADLPPDTGSQSQGPAKSLLMCQQAEFALLLV